MVTNIYLWVGIPWLPSLPVFPQDLQGHEGPVQRKKEKKKKMNKLLLEKVSNLVFINVKMVLTLFPGGPEGPDSPVGPGEP